MLDVGRAKLAVMAGFGLLVVITIVAVLAADLGALGGYVDGWIATDQAE